MTVMFATKDLHNQTTWHGTREHTLETNLRNVMFAVTNSLTLAIWGNIK